MRMRCTGPPPVTGGRARIWTYRLEVGTVPVLVEPVPAAEGLRAQVNKEGIGAL